MPVSYKIFRLKEGYSINKWFVGCKWDVKPVISYKGAAYLTFDTLTSAYIIWLELQPVRAVKNLIIYP